jgi:hypothetical protein
LLVLGKTGDQFFFGSESGKAQVINVSLRKAEARLFSQEHLSKDSAATDWTCTLSRRAGLECEAGLGLLCGRRRHH